MKTLILPPSTIGIIGGGQLGRMMAISAKQMGYKIASLDPTPNSPLGQIADVEIVGPYDDFEKLTQLAEVSDVITYEFENICEDALAKISETAYVPQGIELLYVTKHRLREKTNLEKMGIPVAPFVSVTSEAELVAGLENLGYPAVLKTCEGGYDGKGQTLLRSAKDIPLAAELFATQECILEKWVSFSKEISVVVSRNLDGELAVYPVGENVHRNHILHTTTVPADVEADVQLLVKELGKRIAEGIHLVGTLAVEMFLCADGQIYVNELAPRPHNSGHYTMDGCVTSQFEQHIRAICNLPLGSTLLKYPILMVNILGEHYQRVIDNESLWKYGKMHVYGKSDVKVGRKMGHVNIPSQDFDDTNKFIDSLGIWNQEYAEVQK